MRQRLAMNHTHGSHQHVTIMNWCSGIVTPNAWQDMDLKPILIADIFNIHPFCGVAALITAKLLYTILILESISVDWLFEKWFHIINISGDIMKIVLLVLSSNMIIS